MSDRRYAIMFIRLVFLASLFESCQKWVTTKINEGAEKMKELLAKYGSDVAGVGGLALMLGGVATFWTFETTGNYALLAAAIAEAFIGAQGVGYSYKKGREDKGY